MYTCRINVLVLTFGTVVMSSGDVPQHNTVMSFSKKKRCGDVTPIYDPIGTMWLIGLNMERHEISDINLMTSCEEKVREVLEKEDD